MVGIIYVYVDTGFGFYGYFFSFFKLLSWMFEYDCLETCCFWVSYMYVFWIFVLVPFQRN